MFIASLLFGISASLDALLVGISYGIRGIRIRFWQNLAISLITLLGTCLSVGLGHRLAGRLPSAVSDYAGSLVLILLGLYYIVKWAKTFRPRAQQPCGDYTVEKLSVKSAGAHTAEEPYTKSAEPGESLALPEILSLSLVLSLNNLSAGFSASLAGLPLSCAAVSTFACSVLFLFSGNRMGGSPLLQLAGRAADPLSGALLIGLGIVQLLL